VGFVEADGVLLADRVGAGGLSAKAGAGVVFAEDVERASAVRVFAGDGDATTTDGVGVPFAEAGGVALAMRLSVEGVLVEGASAGFGFAGRASAGGGSAGRVSGEGVATGRGGMGFARNLTLGAAGFGAAATAGGTCEFSHCSRLLGSLPMAPLAESAVSAARRANKADVRRRQQTSFPKWGGMRLKSGRHL
jgi:hypothetical protein